MAKVSGKSRQPIHQERNSRERDVLRLLARGMSNNDIVSTLFLTEGTMQNYVSWIFSKLAGTLVCIVL
ncbi:MAG TPA: LuxR C-terminal-related transcriptional regulator [Anaerolineales bacterium]|nr:LuxR C-terminal-related transcriptional regulator [Anaerolineales bacterium]